MGAGTPAGVSRVDDFLGRELMKNVVGQLYTVQMRIDISEFQA